MPPDKPPKRKPGSGRPKGTGSKHLKIALVESRLGRPPGTGHLQRAKVLTAAATNEPAIRHHPNLQMLPEPAVSGNSRPFNLVCF